MAEGNGGEEQEIRSKALIVGLPRSRASAPWFTICLMLEACYQVHVNDLGRAVGKPDDDCTARRDDCQHLRVRDGHGSPVPHVDLKGLKGAGLVQHSQLLNGHNPIVIAAIERRNRAANHRPRTPTPPRAS